MCFFRRAGEARLCRSFPRRVANRRGMSRSPWASDSSRPSGNSRRFCRSDSTPGSWRCGRRRPAPARLDRIVFTPLAADNPLSKRFTAFERRSPRVGVHLGLRRDCGSTLSQVGVAQTVSQQTLNRFVFEGAIRNFPSPDVEKDNVNYLAGIREIGVRSEYTDGRDMPRLLIRSVEFEGPYYDAWPPDIAPQHFHRVGPEGRSRRPTPARSSASSPPERSVARSAPRKSRL